MPKLAENIERFKSYDHKREEGYKLLRHLALISPINYKGENGGKKIPKNGYFGPNNDPIDLKFCQNM